MTRSLLFFAFAFCWTSLRSQVYTGNLSFQTQLEVDEFLVNNPSITEIDGNVMIWSEGTITNLDGLQNITSISGDLHIAAEGAAVMSLQGLNSLVHVGNELEMVDGGNNGDVNLPDLSGLENLVSVLALDLWLAANIDISVFYGISDISTIVINVREGAPSSFINLFPLVETLDYFGFTYQDADIEFSGFDALTHAGTIHFSDNYSYGTLTFEHFDAFHNLVECEEMTINVAEFTGTFSGFENLQHVSVGLFIDANTVTDYPAFELLETAGLLYLRRDGSGLGAAFTLNSLTSVTSYFGIMGMYDSVTLPVLQSVGSITVMGTWDAPYIETLYCPLLDTIYSDIFLENTLLDNLDGLSNVDFIGGLVDIHVNPELADCSITAVCERLSISPESFEIYLNAEGCNDIEQISAGCSMSFVSGSFYADLDCDGIFNNDDVLMNNVLVLNQDNLPAGTVFSTGNYYLPLEDSTTTLIHATTPLGFIEPDPYTIVTTGEDTFLTGYDFALCPSGEYHNVSVTSSTLGYYPGFNAWHRIVATNYAPQSEEVTVIFDFSGMDNVSVVDSYGGTVNGEIITWNIPSIAFMETMNLDILLHIGAGITNGSIQPAITTIEITGETDDFPSDNTHQWNTVVTGSYDPNDKTVNVQAVDITTIDAEEGMMLDYLIRFQNTGTAPAFFVRVEDVIEEDLDLATIEMIQASHDYQLTFSDDRKVEWLFEDIMLPDSTSDDEGSHGFIRFRIHTKQNLQLSDVISNSASIYFDYNEPVITNVAETVFYTCEEDVSITGDLVICEEGEIVLEIPGVDNVTWTLNGEVVGSTPVYEAAADEPGEYQGQAIATTAYCNYTLDFDLVIVDSPDIPIITQDNNTLTASGNGIFTWTLNGENLGVSGNTIEMTETGTYGVSVMTECTSEIATDLFILCENNLQIGVNETYCEGSDIYFYGSEGWSTYEWTFIGNVISTTEVAEITAPNAGAYSIELSVTSGVCHTTAEAMTTVVANPDVTIAYDTQSGIVSGPSGYEYTWYVNDDLIEQETGNELNLWPFEPVDMNIYAIVTSDEGCFATTNVVILTSVSERNENALSIFPNPANDYITVIRTGIAGANELRITDAIGKIVHAEKMTSTQITLNTQAFSPGIYLVSLVGEKEIAIDTIKLVIE